MPLLDNLLSSPLVESLAKVLRTPITISTGSDFLGELYLDPLYLLPIAGVLACCLLVFAFGFKSTPSIPLHLLVDDDRRPSRKEKKKHDKKPNKQQSNGHANLVKASAKPVVAKPLPKSKSVSVAPSKAESKRDKKADTKRYSLDNDLDDVNAGDWVVVSKKDKKERKPKVDKQEQQTEAAAPYKTKKERKQQLLSGDELNSVDVESKGEKEDSKPIDESVAEEPPKQVLVKQTSVKAEEPVSAVYEEVIAEDPEPEDVLPVSKQTSKKTLKKLKNMRGRSESESNLAVPVQQPDQVDQLPTKVADKVTAEIVAQYEAPAEKQAPKPKKKNKKPIAKDVLAAPVVQDAIIVESKPAVDSKLASKPLNKAPVANKSKVEVQKQQQAVVDIPDVQNDALEGE